MTKIARKRKNKTCHNQIKYNTPPPIMKLPIMNILAALSLATMPAHAVIYSGSLTSGAGLTGNGAWANDSSLSWTVSDEEQGCDGWNYSYNLTVAGKDISHAIIEVSDIFDQSNILGTGGGGIYTLDNYSPDDQGASNPGMPSALRGIKIDVIGDTKSLSWSFCSDIAPVWGDFYAKDGKEESGTVEVYIYNTGFSDDDPLEPVSDGSLNNHIIVPDSLPDPPPDDPGEPPVIIPEPGIAMLGTIGLMLILRRRKQ